MEVDKLMIVAHPDDEVLWGGANLLLQSGWLVVCSTHASQARSREFFSTMSYCNVTRYIMYTVPDIYTEKSEIAQKLYQGTTFDHALKKLSTMPWKLVLSHNAQGEYGHEHHKIVHLMVKKYFPAAKFFKSGPKLPEAILDAKRSMMLYYRKTQAIAKKIFDHKGNTLRKSEREHSFNETVYVVPRREIPRCIHQIWFGAPLDKKSVRYNLMLGVEEMARKQRWQYKCWTNEDLTPENLPLTWEFMQSAIEIGKDTGQSKFAQIADLARYELLHRFGGVYLDSLFEISKKFCEYIHEHRGHELIVANEDPCGLKCQGRHEMNYMSNGFFACVPGCKNLKRLLNYDVLSEIDFENVYVNEETGPYFFRKCMLPRDDVHVIPTDKIYPFMINDSDYRQGIPNPCIQADQTLVHDCLSKRFPESLTVYQSGFGGSWSW